MPINQPWKPLTDDSVQEERNIGGAYELGEPYYETVVYIGSSGEIRKRLTNHVDSDDPCIRRNARLYRVEYTEDYQERERELYDEYVRIHGRSPRCNDKRP